MKYFDMPTITSTYDFHTKCLTHPDAQKMFLLLELVFSVQMLHDPRGMVIMNVVPDSQE